MLVAPSLRHIAKDHLVKCLSAPPRIRHELNIFLESENINLLSYASSLENFCMTICAENGLENKLPIGSGICLIQSFNSQDGSCSCLRYNNGRVQTMLHTKDLHLKSIQVTRFDPHTMPQNDNLSPSTIDISEPDDNNAVDSNEYSAIMKSHQGKSSVEILIGNDREMITDYLALCLQQLGVCYFSRSKCHTQTRDFKEGFPGVECIHCKGKSMNRQFFWSSGFRFVNSSREFSKHLHSCVHCPQSVKGELICTKERHIKQIKELPSGSITAFFHRLFRRLMNELETEQIGISSLENVVHSREGQTLRKLSSNKVLLHVGAEDKWFSEKEILLRKFIEVFCTTEDDKTLIQSKWPGKHVSIGQVGLRCIHCSNNGASYSDSSSFFFPSSMEKIRNDAFRFQHHFKECANAPDSVKETFSSQISFSNSKEKLNMWIEVSVRIFGTSIVYKNYLWTSTIIKIIYIVSRIVRLILLPNSPWR